MNQNFIRIRTRWTDRLQLGEKPTADELREHLLQVHRSYAGFTESCALRCRDSQGRNSYEWLAELLEPSQHDTILDLACGSGVLAALCLEAPRVRSLIAVDMSPEELDLARRRIQDDRAELRQGVAQDLDFLGDNEINLVLCHWALTLMDPVEPVLAEISRVLSPGGVFGAIVDGDTEAADGYEELSELIFKHVIAECPGYAELDLGDPRVRRPDELIDLVSENFENARVVAESGIVSLDGEPVALAAEAVHFFYATFVLSEPAHGRMVREVESFFRKRARSGQARFEMPIHRLVVTTSE